jgi:NAD(P)H-hydrate epimerase
MFLSLTDAVPLAAALPQFSVVAIGPGLGQSDWARSLLQRVLAQPRSGQWLVIDADALNLLADLPQIQRRSDWVLTPHPGEAARLLGITAEAVQADRLAAVQSLQRRYGGTVVLKGSGTLVAGERQVPVLSTRGNPAMASAGMGDVLTGAVAGILAQCRDPWLAACAGVQAHGRAGDALALGGDRSLLAGDLALALGAAIGP